MDPRRILADKEEIRYQTRKHWAVFIKAAIYFGLMALVLAYKEPIRKMVPYASEDTVKTAQAPAQPAKPKPAPALEDSKGSPTVASPKDPLVQDDIKRFIVPVVSMTVKVVCFAVAAVLGLLGLVKLLGFFSTKVVVTSRRVMQHDVLSGSLTSLDIRRIESIRAVTGLLGAILGYGKVHLVMGSGQKVMLADLRKPHQLEREIFSAK